MGGVTRVLWGEGMFLRPQHFQQQSMQVEWLLRQLVESHVAYPAGVRQLSIDEVALEAGVLRIERAHGVMGDGTVVDIPASDPEPLARNLAEIPDLGVEATVYLALPALSLFGANSCEADDGKRSARYTVRSEPATDLFTSAQEAELAVLNLRYVLLVDCESRDGLFAMPIARIVRAPSGRWQVADDYVPPCLDIHASAVLLTLSRRLVEMLFTKSQQLTARHRERSRHIAEYSTTDISSYWLLHTVNRSYPLVLHLLKSPLVHPERLYTVLSQLLGELLTFSVGGSLQDIPAYQHDDLYGTFTALERGIHDLLDTVISSRYVVIPLRCVRPSMFIGQLESERMIGAVDFYLSIESSLPIAQLVNEVPGKIKVGSPEDVEKIIHSALPGVRLVHAVQTPSAIPVRIGSSYFAMEPTGPVFEKMCAARSVCVYVPSSLSELKIELVGVYR